MLIHVVLVSVITKASFEGNGTLHEDLGTLHTVVELALHPFSTALNHIV